MDKVIEKGLIGAWVLLGIWLIYLGVDNLFVRSMETDAGLMAMPPGLPLVYTFERFLLGGFSFVIATVLLGNRDDKVQYLFAFLGILLISVMFGYIFEMGGFAPLLVLVCLIWAKRFSVCLSVLLFSFLFYLVLFEYGKIDFYISHLMDPGMLLIGCLIIPSFFVFKPKNKLLHDIQIGRNYRLLLLLGYVPALLDYFLF